MTLIRQKSILKNISIEREILQDMFSGIVSSTQKSKITERKSDSIRLTLPIPSNWKVVEGDSIAVDGICLTVEKLDNATFSVYAMAETLKRTTLKNLPDDHVFNLEQPLKLADFIGGHLVSGHIDTTAKVRQITNVEESRSITFMLGKAFTKYLVFKGSIAVNGVSLTVTEVSVEAFSVSLIPYTLKNTNLGSLKVGDDVNIECDMLAKQIEKLTRPYLKNL